MRFHYYFILPTYHFNTTPKIIGDDMPQVPQKVWQGKNRGNPQVFSATPLHLLPQAFLG